MFWDETPAFTLRLLQRGRPFEPASPLFNPRGIYPVKKTMMFLGVLGLGFLILTLIPIITGPRRSSDGRLARVQCTELAKALHVFHFRNQDESPPIAFPFTDPTETLEDTEELIAISRGVMRVLGAFDDKLNPKRALYFEIPHTDDCACEPESGDFFDPWCNPYLFRFDDDGDGKIALGAMELEASVIVWSFGKNRRNEWGAGDDIYGSSGPFK